MLSGGTPSLSIRFSRHRQPELFRLRRQKVNDLQPGAPRAFHGIRRAAALTLHITDAVRGRLHQRIIAQSHTAYIVGVRQILHGVRRFPDPCKPQAQALRPAGILIPARQKQMQAYRQTLPHLQHSLLGQHIKSPRAAGIKLRHTLLRKPRDLLPERCPQRRRIRIGNDPVPGKTARSLPHGIAPFCIHLIQSIPRPGSPRKHRAAECPPVSAMDIPKNLCYNEPYQSPERNTPMKARPAKTARRTLSEHGLKKLTFALLGVLLILILVIALFPLMEGDQSKTEATTYAMNGYVQQTVYGKTREEAAVQAADAVQALEDKIAWSTAGSEILTLNTRAGETWLTLSPEVFSMLRTAQDVAEKSGGAFDITVAPVSRLWDFDNERCEVPAAETIAAMLQNVGYQNLRLDEENSAASLKYYGTAVDLSVIGRGAACDAAVQSYAENGVSGAVVSVGSSVGIYGQKPSRTPWNIAVRDPQSESALGTLSINGGFLSTCSRSEKAFTADGETYHHLLDPRTGYPAESGLLSVTVLSGGGALSDALAYASFVLGAENALPLLKAYGAEAVFVHEDGTVTVTDGLRDRFTLTAAGYTLSA